MRPMIEYAKKILPVVSSWRSLFKKELIKCVGWAEPEELFELRNWCYDNFYDKYPDDLNEIFEPTAAFRNKYSIKIISVRPSLVVQNGSYPPWQKEVS